MKKIICILAVILSIQLINQPAQTQERKINKITFLSHHGELIHFSCFAEDEIEESDLAIEPKSGIAHLQKSYKLDLTPFLTEEAEIDEPEIDSLLSIVNSQLLNKIEKNNTVYEVK